MSLRDYEPDIQDGARGCIRHDTLLESQETDPGLEGEFVVPSVSACLILFRLRQAMSM